MIKASLKVPIDDVNRVLFILNEMDCKSFSFFELPDSCVSDYIGENELPLYSSYQIEAYFDSEYELNNFEKTISSMNFPMDIETKFDTKDWICDQFEPFEIAGFCVIPKDDSIPLYIKAGMAFGSGEHQTTKGCLVALKELSERKFSKILDLGTGSGILAIAGCKLFNCSVDAVDIDDTSVIVAQENCKINQCNNSIQCFQSNGFQNISQKYDLIIANILLRPLCQMEKEIIAHLEPKGILIFSGIIESQTAELRNIYDKYCDCLKIIEIEEWVTLLYERK